MLPVIQTVAHAKRVPCALSECRQKDTALHWAAFKGHTEVVQALLQAGANPVSARQPLRPL